MLYTSALIASLIRIAVAQTPFGFSPATNQTLSVSYGNNTVSPAGELLPRAGKNRSSQNFHSETQFNKTCLCVELAAAPTIVTSVFPTTGKAVLFLIDLDVPRNGTRVNLLHWFAPDVLQPASGGPLTVLITSGAPYLQPNPPVGDSPHRYVFLLYSQPSNFTVPTAFANINPPTNTTARVGFNLTNFVKAAGLSIPLAANFITVQNTTGTATITFPAASSTGAPGVAGSSTAGSGASTTDSGSSASATSSGAAIAGAKVAGGSGVAMIMAIVGFLGLV
jgi:phosphatidylethanolamine-binding protein (PEBP) family uncharacterized protein